MNRHIIRALAALLTFTAGLAAAPIRFELLAIGHGYVAEGGGAFFSARYRSSYFVDLVCSGGMYPTPGKADEQFESRLKEAVLVLERTPKLSKQGAVAGKRAVAIFADGVRNEPFACVLWTEGRGLGRICSASLAHVLSFEHQEDD